MMKSGLRRVNYSLEWEKLQKKEKKFLQAREQKKDSLINQKLEEKVPAILPLMFPLNLEDLLLPLVLLYNTYRTPKS